MKIAEEEELMVSDHPNSAQQVDTFVSSIRRSVVRSFSYQKLE